MIVGCNHNLDRVFEYGEMTGNNGWRLSYDAGDIIKLKCPHGCIDIVFDVKSQKQKMDVKRGKKSMVNGFVFGPVIT